MANVKIADLTAATSVNGTDIFESEQSTNSVKSTALQIRTYALGNGFTQFTGPTTADKTFTLPNASSTILTTNAAVTIAQGGTGQTTANLARNALNKGTAALTDGATISTDASLGNVFTVTLGGNRTLANPTNLAAGATYMWVVTQDATGSRTLSYGTNWKWAGGSAPTLSTTANAVDVITAVSPDGTLLYAVCNKGFA